jgi:death on curing protein
VPTWVLKTVVLAIHDEQIAEHGGRVGLRDEGLLDSALARPRNLHSHEKVDLPRLAASYAYGIARNHPFVDGNKRTSLVVTETFIKLNRFELVAADTECLDIWNLLAAGKIGEKAMVNWLRQKITKLSRSR